MYTHTHTPSLAPPPPLSLHIHRVLDILSLHSVHTPYSAAHSPFTFSLLFLSGQDDEEEVPTPTVLKVRIPKPGALAAKQQEDRLPKLKVGAWLAESMDTKKSKRKKGSGSKKSKKGSAGSKEEVKKEEAVKVEEAPEQPPQQQQSLGPFKFRLSNGKFVQ